MPTIVYQRSRHHKVATSSSNGFYSAEENGFEEALTTDVGRVLNDSNANDNCSSSKSNLELSSAALRIAKDDAGDCSSSGKAPIGVLERDVCISILRSQGMLDKVSIRHDQTSNESIGPISSNYCSKSCKVCEHSDSTKNMLICDNCNVAFHASCCNPHIRILPVGEWLCSSCLKKKHKILKDKSSGSNLVLGSLEFMFRDTEPYMSNVRIGDEFQADVPDWRDPSNEECSPSGNPLEMVISTNTNKQEGETTQPSNRSSIGNWLQCRASIERAAEGDNGTVCAKWRRAPLFEVQTDNWECFRCVLWNPSLADCAVPQELDTEEVMKQLKYIEMLRPRLSAKRRKLDSSKG